MGISPSVTKILFIESDEFAFQVRKCVALALGKLPPVELYHAVDATEGLSLLETLKPDVVVLDEECPEECHLFLDSLLGAHPPIILQSDDGTAKQRFPHLKSLTIIERNDSLEGIHSTLVTAASVAGVTPEPRHSLT